MSLALQLSSNLALLNYKDLVHESSKKECLLFYLALIKKWNAVHNLTAIRNPLDMLSHHIMDSLAIMPHLRGPYVVDVGSGAGLPGIPIAIARPDWKVLLVESNQKKAAFLQQAKIELKLNNIDVISHRVENFIPEQEVNCIVSRAFSSLNNFIKLSGHLCEPNNPESRMMAMKGEKFDSIIAPYSRQYEVEEIIPISVPGLDAKRHLVVIKKNT